MNIAVCEDSPKERELLCGYIKNYFSEHSCPIDIAVFDNGVSFLNRYKAGSFHIIFLDIYMPGLTGVDVARKIRETDKDAVIIFATSSIDHALDGYAVDALQYLVKPVEYGKLSAALDKCHNRFADYLRFIEVRSERSAVKILLRDIFYVEIYNTVCIFHTKQGEVKTYNKLDEIEAILGGLPFLRCHRSYLVNLYYVKKIDREINAFVMKNGDRADIRRGSLKEASDAYEAYMFAETRGARP